MPRKTNSISNTVEQVGRVLAILVSMHFSGLAYAQDTLHSATGTNPVATILLPESEEIRLALNAGPEQVRAGASVYVFGKAGYRLARAGTNGFTCLVNRDGNQSGDHDLKPTCWDSEGTRTLVPVMLRVGELLAKSSPAEQIRRDIDAGFSTGRFTSPKKTGIAYMLAGDIPYDPETKRIGKPIFPPHFMLYAPGVTNTDIGTGGAPGLSDPQLPAVYSGYSGGTRTAYIIIMATPHMVMTH